MSDADSELEDDEEEILVYVEFDNFATNDVFSSENLKLDMLGLDSDQPIMQVNGKFFEGTYENAPGTYLFFEKDYNPEIDDSIFDQIPTVKYFNKTRKLLRMQRAFLVPRYEVVGDSENRKCIPNKQTLEEAGVPPKYQNQALEFWKKARNARLEALQKYLKKQEFRKELRLHGFEPESESDEDNPFVMYKYMTDESNVQEVPRNKKVNNCNGTQTENSQKTLKNREADKRKKVVSKKLTVIDPGPSTSKCSTPWVESDPLEDSSFSLEKIKSVGKVRSKVAKANVSKQGTPRKQSLRSHKNSSEHSATQCAEFSSIENVNMETENNSVAEKSKLRESNRTDTSVVQPKRSNRLKQFRVEEVYVDEAVTNESERLLSNELNLSDQFVPEVKRIKQEKREAKMREISARLKSLDQSSRLSKS